MSALNPAGEVKLIAFYLPQFHPIPENDRWWGAGFTEWTNVVSARPAFLGHYQPHLPAELGFYDLRLTESRNAQAALAKAHGIYGFCLYHYWFRGRRLLGEPLDDVLRTGEPDFPFCLCWANENWTRRWDGRESEVLVEQTYDTEDDLSHIRWLARVFQDRRYIRIEGKPLFSVYRPSKLPDPLRTTSLWRKEARSLGVGEIFLCAVESLAEDRGDPTSNGFDAAIEFQPDWLELGSATRRLPNDTLVYDYSEVVDRMLRKNTPTYRRFGCVTPMWDNSPRRRKNAIVLSGSTPAFYGKWLRGAIEEQAPNASGEKITFVNAWNEWAEGAHLEPCQKWGRGYLEETRRVLEEIRRPRKPDESARVPTPKRGLQGLGRKVTVCIPAFNGARYLAEALQSVLSQSLAELDLIVVDDCSMDETARVVKTFTDERVQYHRNPRRLGLVGNWNRCLDLARGEFVCLFHQDDIMLPDNLQTKVEFLERHSTAGIVHSNVLQVDENGDILSKWWYSKPKRKDHGIHRGSEYFKTLWSGLNIICCPSVVARRDLFEALGGFDSRLSFTADWEMWMRTCLFRDVGYLTNPLIKYRRHEEAETNRFLKVDGLRQYFLAKRLVLDKFPDRVPDAEKMKLELGERYECEALAEAISRYHRGEHDEARRYLEVAGEIFSTTTGCPPEDDYASWFLQLASHLAFPEGDGLNNNRLRGSLMATNNMVFSGKSLADRFGWRTLVKALAWKLAERRGFRWLSRLRNLARRGLVE